MARVTFRRHLLLYLIPTVVGLAGIRLSQEFADLPIRVLILLVSVSIPLFAAGNLLSRYQGRRLEQALLLCGVLFLLIGAVASLSVTGESVYHAEDVPQALREFSLFLGIGSLFLGLFVTLLSVVRTQQNAETLALQFRKLAEHIAEGFLLLDPQGRIFAANQQFADLFGMEVENLIGANILEVFTEVQLSNAREYFSHPRARLAAEYEVTWLHDNTETELLISTSPVHDPKGTFVASVVTVRDITELQRLTREVQRYARELERIVSSQQQEIQQSEERFRNILLAMNEGFVALDTEYRIQFVNNFFCDLIGLSKEALIQRNILEYVDTLSRVRLLNLLQRAAHTQSEQLRAEIQFIHADKEPVPCLLGLSIARTSGNDAFRYCVAVAPIGDLKRMQEQLEARARDLEKANEALREQDRAKDVFLSNVSHELRTPLSTVQGYLEMLLEGQCGPLTEPQRSALHVMERNAERLAQLIQELIQFARMEIQSVHLDLQLFTVGSWLEDVAAAVVPNAMHKDLSLEVHVDSALAPAWGDPEKLAQTLSILLDNAVKFTPTNGKIYVAAQAVGEDTLELRVRDTGIGIDRKYHERIFEKFFQVDSSISRRYGGAGIGLSIAKGIVEAHGGNIRVQSKLGKGSEFIIELPKALFYAADSQDFCSELHNVRILIASEKPSTREALADIVRRWGTEALTSGLGYECLRSAQKSLPGVICLLEHNQWTQLETTLRLLHEDDTVHTVPVVVCSSPTCSEYLKATLNHDVVFLPMPFDASRFAQTLVAALHGEVVSTALDVTAPIEKARPVVVAVEKSPELQQFLEFALAQEGISCICVRTASEIYRVANGEAPYAVLVNGDDEDGEVLNTLRVVQENPNMQSAAIVVVTAFASRWKKAPGVTAVLEKPFTADSLYSIVHSRATGHGPSNLQGPKA